MSSPVQVPYQSFVKIDLESSSSRYMQIANQLINAIQRGFLISGTKLPGTRSMASILGEHRKTIVAAYDELDAQGWVEVIPNKGTFVLSEKKSKKNRFSPISNNQLAQYPKETGYSFEKTNLLDNPFDYANCELIFNDGTPDVRLNQMDQLSRVYSSNIKRKNNQKKFGYYNQEGSEYFKENLSNYLNLSRGLHISKNNLLITRSTEMSVYIISQILLRPLDSVVVASLSYFSVNMIFQKSGARIFQVPIDDEGIDVEAVRTLCMKQPIRMLYLTPHHHYPTTVTLSAQRRIDLLALSSEYGFVILEDDYDYDFHYDKSAVLPLASSDTEGMVIYVGSFGKSLAPGFRTGFVVAPENVMREMRKYLGIIDRQGDVLMEQVLGEMIEEGEIHRHLKKSLKIYQQRRDEFASLLKNELGDYVDFKIPTGGLAIWTEWDSSINLMRLAAMCQKNQLFIPRTLLYQSRSVTAMRLGFGHLNEEEMRASVEVVKKVLR